MREDELRMPMGGEPLPPEDVAVLKRWISEGARVDAGVEVSAEPDWWAFRKPVRPEPPAVENQAWVKNTVDRFILQRLEQRGLEPAPPAERRMLIRRAYFDLHGLPPSPEQVEAFVNDDSPEAYEKLIDELLDSPRYGERWGRHWLDVVRYADTGGFETDIYFPNAWRYRDYVIQSFNEDKPFDRFIQEQIAGDELWPDDLELRGGYEIPEEKQEHLEARIGTGLYTIGTVYHEAALNGQQLRYEWMVDAVDMTGEAFLGLTVRCARCHDHKFDPVSQVGYHRMMALFAGSEIRQAPVVNKMSEFGFYSGYTKLLKVEEYQEAVARLDKRARQRIIDGIVAKFPPEVAAAYRVGKKDRTAEQERLVVPLERAITEAGLNENAAGYKAELPYTPQERDERQTLINELGKAALEARFELPSATVLGHSDVLYPVKMSSRGDWRAQGERVEPGFPAVLTGKPLVLNEPPEGPFLPRRRKALAQWLSDPAHPLTARVMVNRLWQGHFGRGIVATPNNFGRQGEPPTHPELLDWLATEFVEQGWSIKKMHKLMMLSNTYQMSARFDEGNAKIDPDNRYFWRMNRRRLEAETMRDAILTVSGTLNTKAGGRPVIPPLTDEEKLGMWAPHQWPESLDPADHNRRSVYLIVKRQFPYPLFTTFDMPDSSASCGRRDVTTVAPQALTMLNGSFMLAKAAEFAARLAQQDERPEEWIDTAWRLAFARPPTPEESRSALELLAPRSALAGDAKQLESASDLTQFCLMIFNMNEFLYVD